MARRVLLAALLALVALPHTADAAGRCGSHPWCDTSLSPDRRAQLLLNALTPDERIELLAGDEQFGVTAQRTRRCTSRRRVRITPKRVRRGKVRKITVFVGGKREKVLHGPRKRVKVKLAGLAKGRDRVRVVTRTTRGRRLVQTRTYRTCAKKRPAKRTKL